MPAGLQGNRTPSLSTLVNPRRVVAALAEVKGHPCLIAAAQKDAPTLFDLLPMRGLVSGSEEGSILPDEGV